MKLTVDVWKSLDGSDRASEDTKRAKQRLTLPATSASVVEVSFADGARATEVASGDLWKSDGESATVPLEQSWDVAHLGIDFHLAVSRNELSRAASEHS